MSSLNVVISADTADATAKLAVLKSSFQDQTATLKELAAQAAASGASFDSFSPELLKAAEAAAQSKAQIKSLTAEMRQVHEGAGGFTDTLSDWRHGLLGLTDPIRGVYSGMGQLGEVFAAGAVIEGLRGFGEAAIETAAEIQRNADAVGLASDTYQAFVQAGVQVGVEQQVIVSAIQRFQNAAGEAAAGMGLYAKAFEELNVSAGMPAEDAIPAVARAILALQNTTEQARLEVLLFGRSGEEMRPALEQLAQGADELKEKMAALGLIIDPKVTAAAEKADTDWQNMKTRLEADVLPAVTAVTNALLAMGEALGGSGYNDTLFRQAENLAKMGEDDAFTKYLQRTQPQGFAAMSPNLMSPQAPQLQAPDISGLIDEYKKAQEEAKKFGDEVRRVSDAAAADAKNLADKQVAAAEQANNFELSMGRESLETWRQNADREAKDKYDAEVSYLQKKAAADKGDAAAERHDQDMLASAYRDYKNRLATIDQQYAEKKRQTEQQELSDFIAADNAKLQDGIRAADAQFTEHRINADRRFALEQALTKEIYGEEIARVNALIATLTAGTKAYEDAIKQRERIEQQFAKQSEANTNQLETQEAQKWTQLGNSIKSSFNSAIDGLIFQGNTFRQFMLNIAEGVAKAFLSMGETIAENWIETQIAAMFETKATQGTTALGEVGDAAAVAGANAYAAYAAYPPVAAAMAADAVATTMGFSSLIALDVGAWDLKSDMVAQLHKGEMVVPENFASGLRSGGGIGGGDVALHYAPTIHSREPASLGQMLSTHGHEMHAWLRREFRNGSLRV